MTEQLKFILNEVNKLLNTKYDLIKFDALNEVQLMQILIDVLSKYEAGPAIAVSETGSEVVTLHVLEALRRVKYRPGAGAGADAGDADADADADGFRNALLRAERHIVLSLLHWLLKNREQCIKTAYLARYLTRPDLPEDVIGGLSDLLETYDKLMGDFKEVHKRTRSLTLTNGSEIISDIKEIAIERDMVIKRLESVKVNLLDLPEKEELLTLSKSLRQYEESNSELKEQLSDQSFQLKNVNEQLQRCLGSFRGQSSIPKAPEELITKIREEIQLNEYLVSEKLPLEFEQLQKELNILQKVQNEIQISRQDLIVVQEKIESVNRDIENLVQKKMLSSNPQDDKLTPFRQQAAGIKRNKEGIVDRLQELSQTLRDSEATLAEKQSQVQQLLGDSVLSGEELKKYVNKLRSKSTVYKRQRAALSALKIENGILARTLDILGSEDPTLETALLNHKKFKVDVEMVSLDEKAKDNDLSKRTLHELTQMVSESTKKIADVKSEILPLANNLAPIRETYQKLQQQYQQKKRVYDATTINLTSQMEPLEQKLKELNQDIAKKEEEWKILRQKIEKAENFKKIVENESKDRYSSLQSPRKISKIETLQNQIFQLEKNLSMLQEEQKSISKRQSEVEEQSELWRQSLRLLQCKLRSPPAPPTALTITHRAQTLTLLNN